MCIELRTRVESCGRTTRFQNRSYSRTSQIHSLEGGSPTAESLGHTGPKWISVEEAISNMMSFGGES